MSVKIFLLTSSTSNWRSVERSLLSGDFLVETINFSEISKLKKKSLLILPGVGNIKSFYSEFNVYCDINKIREFISKNQIKIIGICLGFQFLCKSSSEDYAAKCLNILDLQVESIYEKPRPSVGWKKLKLSDNNSSSLNLFKFIDGKDFYFTHSFAVKKIPNHFKYLECYTYEVESDTKVLGAVVDRNIIGFQFHPEKSGKAGTELLARAIEFLEKK